MKTLEQLLIELTARRAKPAEVIETILMEGGMVFSPEQALRLRQLLNLEAQT